MRKYGVCSARISPSGHIKKGKSLKIYGKGTVEEKAIEREIIPEVERKCFNFPIVIYSYFSNYPPSRTGLDIIRDGRGIRHQPRKPSKKSYDWLVDENRQIHDLTKCAYFL